MWWRKKKAKIEYCINIPRIEETDLRHSPWYEEMIPIRMSKLTPEWFKRIRVDILNSEKHSSNIRVCPSFVSLLTNGYVIRNPATFKVTGMQKEDGEGFTDIGTPLEEHFSVHEEDMFGDAFPFLEDFLPFSLKIQNALGMHTDREVAVVFLPCWWDENHTNIRAIHGYIRWKPSRDLYLNVNSFIRRPKLGETYSIPKGAPLVQLLFVDPVDVEFVRNDDLRNTDGQIKAALHFKIQEMAGKFRNIGHNIKDFIVGKQD